MALWSFALDVELHPMVKYRFLGYAVGLRVRIEIMIGVRVQVRVGFTVSVNLELIRGAALG